MGPSKIHESQQLSAEYQKRLLCSGLESGKLREIGDHAEKSAMVIKDDTFKSVSHLKFIVTSQERAPFQWFKTSYIEENNSILQAWRADSSTRVLNQSERMATYSKDIRTITNNCEKYLRFRRPDIDHDLEDDLTSVTEYPEVNQLNYMEWQSQQEISESLLTETHSMNRYNSNDTDFELLILTIKLLNLSGNAEPPRKVEPDDGNWVSALNFTGG